MPTVSLIDLDPQLAAQLPSAERELARRYLVAATLDLPSGQWDPEPLGPVGRRSLGLLVLEGLLARATTLAGRTTAQLFGPTDLLRPWSDPETDRPETTATGWTILIPATVALLDQRFITYGARWPLVLVELARRSEWQATRTAIQLGVARLPRLDDRLLIVFWQMAQACGRVTPDGIRVPLDLSHGTLARIVAASRPPVSTALARLGREGLIRRTPGGWLVDPQVEHRLAALSAGRA